MTDTPAQHKPASKITLTRRGPGHYTATVVVKGAGGDPFEATVKGPQSEEGVFARANGIDTSHRWVVETDTERFFDTLAQCRDYLNRFFERPA